MHAGVVAPHDDFGVAREAAIRLLARREHSTDELRRKLKRRGHDAGDHRSRSSPHCVSPQSVSDERFAESFARVRSERGQGPLRIRSELRERGVTDVLVDEVLTTTSEYWLERAQRARGKRFGDGAARQRATIGTARLVFWRSVAFPPT